ncbi:MAG: carnosine N-methyltransferase family protein [Gammaproteobacteria bacterium]|nr:carnosine N-methyltransferase family protein [Gammaproteobacteria bacterium]MBU2678539.1 carnosine N-methyltransferase family protein [Gammaproteobacteria bacterium]NNC55982.1 methyltransferase domain-containing protein [Woeseiaceae bacterium]NNL52274.1 methyltransferase domain-containing protein [Woeseiaceae bacterium]
MTGLSTLLACPRCDKTPLDSNDGHLHCKACKVDFPSIGGIPWMFAEPQATLGEWRGRLQFALQQLGHEIAGLERELKTDDLQSLTRRRVERYKKAVEYHHRALSKLLRPVDMQAMQGNYESYLALRTRLPADQGLNTYYTNIHRDWAWGDDENNASLKQIQSVLHDHAELGRVLVLGAGAGRLAYDIHRKLSCTTTVAMDFNPLLMLVAQAVTQGEQLKLYEFPIAPLSFEDDAVLRTLSAPEVADDRFHLLLGDALRAPFPAQSFDTVITPWLIDVITEDLPVLAARINNLLTENGRWVNFGSLAFSSPERARRYSPEETKTIVAESGFSDPYVSQKTIPYMCSPASRHGRQEKVFSFSTYKERGVDKPERYKALPDWIVTGKEPVPLSPSFRTQAMTTQVYSFIMSLIDGKRSIKDMAAILETQRLMSKEEAEPAIRTFLTKMYDDSRKQSTF